MLRNLPLPRFLVPDRSEVTDSTTSRVERSSLAVPTEKHTDYSPGVDRG